MEIFWSFLTVLVTSTAISLTAFFILKNFSEKELHKKRFEVKMKNQSLITPIRLQAYERITLFLERIEPNSMIMRIQSPNMTVKQLQFDLLTTIRAEFEHNIAQQIYLSVPAWNIVKSAKENTIKIVNTCADKIDKEAPAIELSKAILTQLAENIKSPNELAIEFIKKEVGQYF
ncbi:MAG: hypothetical protein ABIJ97_18315 [Bacteroidota bacterium]